MLATKALLNLAMFTAAILPVADAAAQAYPVRPLRLVTMFAGGSATDVMARFTAQRLSEQLGQTVVVENKGGAGGLIGTQDVLRAQPVGYSLLFAAPSLIGNLYAYRNPQYRLEDLTAVGAIGLTSYGMIVHASVPATTLLEFIAYARANPGKLNYGSIGLTAGNTLLSERLKQAAGIDMVMVPFKGGDPASVALLSGDIQVYFATLATTRTRMRNAQIRGIAISAEQRSRILPELPTFRELGFPTLVLAQWDAVFVPAMAPLATVKRLQDAMMQVNAAPEMKLQLEKVEREPWPGTLEQFIAYTKAEGAAVGADFKKLNIPVLD